MQTTLAEAADMTEKAEEEPGPILESRQEQESETKASATIPFARLNEQEEAHEEKQTRPNYMEKFGELVLADLTIPIINNQRLQGE